MSNCTKYNKSNIGKIFSFKILKEITLPDDSNTYYVISDNKNCKFTIPQKNYAHYGLKIGQQINCSLDRINCSGQIFLEPLNPFYKENSIYEFDFIEFKKVKNYLGIDENIVIVKDKFGKDQWIRHAKNLNVENSKVKALVSFIKKGKLFLVPENSFINLLKERQTYDFKIVGKKHTERFGEVYLLNDSNGNLHAMPSEFYRNYKLKYNKWFKASIHKFSSKGFFYIEPLHPYYELKKSYSFRLFETLIQNEKNHLFVEDCFGNIIQIESASKIDKSLTKINCKVIGFKKGRPILVF